MIRRTLALALGFALAAGVASADAMTDTILRALQAEGYTEIEIESTWLGRTRIEAEGPHGSREIVFNPRTGEILRDLYDRDDDFDLLDIENDDDDNDNDERPRNRDRSEVEDD